MNVIQQGAGRSIKRLGACRPIDHRPERRGEFFAQLDAPLIERVDAHDNPFDKNAMLVGGDDLT